MFKKNNVYPCKPQFYYIKVGFKGVKIIEVCFRDDNLGDQEKPQPQTIACQWHQEEEQTNDDR